MQRVDFKDLDSYENCFLATDIFVDGKILLCKSSILNKENLNIIKNNKDKIYFKFYIYTESNDKEVYDKIVENEIQKLLSSNLSDLLKYHINLSENETLRTKEVISLLLKSIFSERFYISYLGNIMLCNEDLFQHLVRVATMSALLSIRGNLPKQMIIDITIGALLHDIGKFKLFIKYPELSDYKRKYSIDEYKLMQSHPILGYEELKENTIVPIESKKIVLLHHVWDNREFSFNDNKNEYMSYPTNYQNTEITPQLKDTGVSIVQVANLYDNMFQFKEYYEKQHIQKRYISNYLSTNDLMISGNGAGILLDSVIFKANTGDKVLLSNNKVVTIVKMQEIPKQPVVEFSDGNTMNLMETDIVVKELISK